MTDASTLSFVTESNRIEGLTRKPSAKELNEHERFLLLDRITVEEMQRFVAVYEPKARLRDKKGLDVRVGKHVPLPGGVQITYQLQKILADLLSPYQTHVAYEILHPFTDCNGRSGRALWAWHMRYISGRSPRNFLRPFYYQALE